ncbi:MAG: hypothetical protein Q9170_002787 [Blastenia crenularia]
MPDIDSVAPVPASNSSSGITNGTAAYESIEPRLNGVNGFRRDNEAMPTTVTNGDRQRHQATHNPRINGLHSDHHVNRVNGIDRSQDSKVMNGNIKHQDDEAPPPIAICGMGMRLPGGVNGENDFWDLLINKKSGRSIVPEDRYNVEAFYSPTGGPGTVKTKHGYFLKQVDLQHLDASFFSMNKTEVERLDPQQRLLLEVVWECMENAGQVGWRGKQIGCYVGVFGEDWLDMGAKDTQIDQHVVAGTNLMMTPTMTIAMTEQGVLSPEGRCKSFDAQADGYARGEAINAVYIKKLSDAVRDGDPVRAVIRGTATNCDGKTPGMACPSSETHEAMMRRAYHTARLSDFSETAYVECHGTGTQIGDPLETAAIANVFGHNGVIIGSVKPNVGHSEGASGVTSLIKAVLALEHKIIPPNINFSEPNPKIPWEKARLQVPVEPMAWPTNRERASVNSFGIGGANAHVVIDSTSSLVVRPKVTARTKSRSNRPHLLVFSAGHPESVSRSVAGYQEYLESHPHLVGDLAHTLGARREHLTHRSFCVTDGKEPLEIASVMKTKSCPKIVFVFTGQGAQWAGMAKHLWEDFDRFRNDIKEMDGVLAGLPSPPSWTIEGELTASDGASRIDEAEISQPLCTALQIGLVNLLRSFGVFPAAVVGHSSGEIGAAYTANTITFKAAILIAYYRGQVSKGQTRPGGMLAVGMGKDAVSPYLIEGVVVACENSPDSVTLSGDKKQINKVALAIADKLPDMFVRPLKVSTAYHSNHMEEVGAEYQALLQDHVPTAQLEVPFYSSVSGKLITDPKQLGPLYWRQNLESPVLFHSATRAILEELPEGSLFLEVGPHSALGGPLRQIFKSVGQTKPPSYLTSLTRGKDGTASLLNALGQMYLLEVSMNFEVVTPGETVLTGLPTYPWRHETKHWSESRVVREWRMRKFPRHELLGSRTLEGNELEPAWRNLLQLDDVPWVQDHKIIDDIVFPAAGYISMAGEAVRQLTETSDFTLRHVLIKTALVLQHSKIAELMTCLRKVRLTTALDSDWYEFVVSSYNGTSWMEHCIGQVRAGREQSASYESIETLPREVSTASWYSAMKRVGLNYGPAFQGLTDITAGPDCGTSVASFSDRHRAGGALYQLHPTTIDWCLQLYTVSATNGVARRLQNLCVPTSIDELYIRQGSPEMRAKVTVSSSTKGSIGGNAVVMAGEELVMQLKGGSFTALEDQGPNDVDDPVAAARLEWRPDIDFLNAENLMRTKMSVKDEIVKLERLTLLCSLEIRHRLSDLETKSDHLKKFQDWLDIQADRARSGSYPLVEDAQTLASLPPDERLRSIEEAHMVVKETVGADIGKILQRVLDSSNAIFAQQVDPIDILLQEDGLKTIYGFFSDMWDCREFLQLLGHTKPNLKVLEIGAGTGGTTAAVLNDLITESGQRTYSEYCYTDISAGFFVTAKERFKEFQNIEYAVLDISKDPIEQGFEADSYDFILAANGILPGWWLGDSDGRPDEPYISVERWDRELKAAGFSGVDSAVYDDDLPYQINVNIVSRPARDVASSKTLTLLCDDVSSPMARQVEAAFVHKGYSIDHCTINDLPPANQDIVSVMDLNAPFFDKISPENLTAFQRYLGNLKSSGILWVSRSSQVGCKDPRYSQVLGAARTVRSELLIDFATFEIDDLNEAALEALTAVFSKFQIRTKGPELDPDMEFALVEGAINIPRYHWISVADELATAPEEELPRKLEIGKTGVLQTLQWVQRAPVVLQDDHVEVEPCAIGLNFKDILVCMGIVEPTKEGIGLEGAGLIRRIGSKVQDLKVGDRVMMFEHGCFSTRIAIAAELCSKIPDDLSFEEAATMPCVYSTVIHALLTLGRLEKGQIFATVGNDDKVQYLINTFGIARHQIFNSRNSSFLADIKRETNGRGVDVVLNSLSGELLHTSWQCVAEYGKMLEIGKRDFIGRGMLSMDLFEANRSFFGIDLARLGVEKPEACKRLLDQCIDFYRQGAIGPIKPMKVFDSTNLIDAFKYMQKGQHIGKIVVTMPKHPEELCVTAVKQELRLRPEASYLLVGGLGGLGKAIATWMVERGARNLIFLSRSAGKSEEDRKFFRELKAQTCSVQAVCGSVDRLEDIQHAVENAAVPIAGVMHMSMVLKDRNFLEFSHDEWRAAVAPKVEGAWNLHKALSDKKLDFFILFSSISSIVGQWGQGNYASANTFLDSFVQYRHSLGLPASSINIGVMEDVGYVSQNPAVLEQFRATSAHLLREQDLMDTLHLMTIKSIAAPPSAAYFRNPAQTVIGLRSTRPLADPSNRAIWKRDVRMSLYRNLEAGSASGNGAVNDDLKAFLAAVAREPSMLNEQANLEFLTHKIGVRLYNFMLQSEDDIDVKQSLSGLGIDSLVAIEIRNWWRQGLGLEISVLEIMNAGSIEQLGKNAADSLQRKHLVQEGKEEDTYLLMKAP